LKYSHLFNKSFPAVVLLSRGMSAKDSYSGTGVHRVTKTESEEKIVAVLSGFLLPLLLVSAGIYFAAKLRFFWILHPIRTAKQLLQSVSAAGTSPFAALTMALAGTLGVGNIAGVATAITAGGAGAVLWMILGACAAMSVKYAEVYLAVRWRRTRRENGISAYFGGAMYYIRDGITARARTSLGRRIASLLGGGFAVLCLLNTCLTGGLVQVYAAVRCVPLPPLLFGMLFALVVWILSRRGTDCVAALTAVVIPILAGAFLLLSLGILFTHRTEIPFVLQKIWEEAWDFSSAAGGVLGFGVSRAVRFGITRGIFSNEAGCGTAPTAHAAAQTVSPHHQGCFGIFEVFADTVLLCSVTALVILCYRDGEGLDGIELALTAYTRLADETGGAVLGAAANLLLRLSIVLFALATVICQSCYGMEAVRYFTSRRIARIGYRTISTAAILLGSVISPGPMWQCADAVVTVMTLWNVGCLLLLRREIE